MCLLRCNAVRILRSETLTQGVRQGLGGGGVCRASVGTKASPDLPAIQAAVFWGFYSAAVRQHNEDQEEKD